MYQAFYSARLDHLQLQSLERRCLIADLVLTYRIIFGLIDLNMSDHFMLQSSSGCSAATRGNPYKLLVNHRRINVRKHFFSERIIRVWNSLPPSIVSFKSLFSFRNSLDDVNLGIYTKYWLLFFNLFLLSMYLVFSLRLIVCVLLLYACICRLCDM